MDDAPSASHDERGPAGQLGHDALAPAAPAEDDFALARASAASRMLGPDGAPTPSRDEPHDLTMAKKVLTKGPNISVPCHTWVGKHLGQTWRKMRRIRIFIKLNATHRGLRIRGSESTIPPLRLPPPTARENAGLRLFLKTTVARPRQPSHTLPTRRQDRMRTLDPGYGYFSLGVWKTRLCVPPPAGR